MTDTMFRITNIVINHGMRSMEHPLHDLWMYFDAEQRAVLTEVAQTDPATYRDYDAQLRKEIIERDIVGNGPLIVRLFVQYDTTIDTFEWRDWRIHNKIRGEQDKFGPGYFFVRANRDGEVIGDDAEVFTGEGNQRIPYYVAFKDGLIYHKRIDTFKPHEVRLWGHRLVDINWFLTEKEYFEWMEAHPQRLLPGANRLPPPWERQANELKILVGVGAEYRPWMHE